MWDHFVFHCLLHQYLFGPLCIATVGICLISRPTYMWDHFECLPHQYLCVTTLYCISTYVGPLCIARLTSSVPMWDHFALHQYLCGTTLYCTVYLISTYVGPLCIASVPMWDHFVLHCLPHQYLCGTTLHCISTYMGPLCVALFTSRVPMWDHFVLHQYLCGTTLHCTVYLISTYVRPLCIAKVGIYLISRPTYMCVHFVLHCDCLPHQYLCGLLCIASVPMWDHFVLHCLPHQYLCGTTLHCISTYMGPLCISLFTSSVHMWDHIVLYQYLCGTTLYCTVYFTSTYLDHFVLQQYVYTSSVGLSACVTTLYCTVTVYLINTYVGLLCIASVPMWDHFVLHRLSHQTTLYCTVYFTSTYLDHFVLQQ